MFKNRRKNRQGGTQKLNASLTKIEKVFEKMYHKKIYVGKSPMSESTVKVYADLTIALMRDVHRKYGVSDITKVKKEQVAELFQERIDKYHDSHTNEASNLNSIVSAVTAFTEGVKETNIFKRELEFGDPKGMRNSLREQNVFRNSRASRTLRATPGEAMEVIRNIKQSGYDTRTRNTAAAVSQISLGTGGRISSILKLTPADIEIDEKTNKIRFLKDKGGLTRSVEITDKDTLQFLKGLTEGKKPNERLFSFKRKDGTFLSVAEMRKSVTNIITNAGRDLARTEKVKVKDRDGNYKYVSVPRKFTPHSFRKSFALQRCHEYLRKIPSDPKKLQEYVQQLKDSDPKLKSKIETMEKRINASRNTVRQLRHDEVAIFLVSKDLGHFRKDIVTSFYTTFAEVQKYYDEV
ncbi:site-specific integrase [Priestia megaterium]|uniref:site-specific integrase n=1 Tax=Priestia megaterium TaxID=1404 RepID=UPI002E1C6E25|nr:site-specific integrase [Priestia megaterium]